MSDKNRSKYRLENERELICSILHKGVFLGKGDENNIRGVTSPTQTSKTRWIIAQALIAVNEGRNAVIVTRNFNGDETQLVKRLKTVQEIM